MKMRLIKIRLKEAIVLMAIAVLLLCGTSIGLASNAFAESNKNIKDYDSVIMQNDEIEDAEIFNYFPESWVMMTGDNELKTKNYGVYVSTQFRKSEDPNFITYDTFRSLVIIYQITSELDSELKNIKLKFSLKCQSIV